MQFENSVLELEREKRIE